MRDVIRCASCILPETLPSVELDENGICGHCRTYDRLFGDWEEVRSQRRREFEDLLERAKRGDIPYDCLIPLSGGKDSTYTLYLCSKVYGLRCLSVTFDNGFLSEYARRNIKNALEATGADHVFYRIDRGILLRLYKLFLAKCGNFCPACMRGIDVSIEMAVRAFGIPLVVVGHARRIAYLGMIRELFEGGDARFFWNVVKGEPPEKDVWPLLGTISSHIEDEMRMPHRLRIIKMASGLLRVAKGTAYRLLRVPRSPTSMTTTQIGLFDYIDASYDEIYNTLKQEMGWTSPVDEFEHMDCDVHEIPFHIHTLKFPELTKNTFYRSGLIRLGLMTREEAMTAENDELANPTTPQVLDSFLSEIGMSKDEFESSVRDWRSIEAFRRKR